MRVMLLVAFLVGLSGPAMAGKYRDYGVGAVEGCYGPMLRQAAGSVESKAAAALGGVIFCSGLMVFYALIGNSHDFSPDRPYSEGWLEGQTQNTSAGGTFEQRDGP